MNVNSILWLTMYYNAVRIYARFDESRSLVRCSTRGLFLVSSTFTIEKDGLFKTLKVLVEECSINGINTNTNTTVCASISSIKRKKGEVSSELTQIVMTVTGVAIFNNHH